MNEDENTKNFVERGGKPNQKINPFDFRKGARKQEILNRFYPFTCVSANLSLSFFFFYFSRHRRAVRAIFWDVGKGNTANLYCLYRKKCMFVRKCKILFKLMPQSSFEAWYTNGINLIMEGICYWN
jgi:hypothetical protein